MYEPLFAIITTKDELHHLLSALDALQERAYSIKTSLIHEIDTVFPYDKKEIFLSLCQQNHVNLQNMQSLKDCIAMIKKEASLLPVVQLTIAYTPTDSQLQEISRWFEARVGQKYIFDVVVDHGTVGGAVVSAHGMYKDFSLKRFLKEHYGNITY